MSVAYSCTVTAVASSTVTKDHSLNDLSKGSPRQSGKGLRHGTRLTLQCLVSASMSLETIWRLHTKDTLFRSSKNFVYRYVIYVVQSRSGLQVRKCTNCTLSCHYTHNQLRLSKVLLLLQTAFWSCAVVERDTSSWDSHGVVGGWWEVTCAQCFLPQTNQSHLTHVKLWQRTIPT
mgnify:CR=1 FL=1